jgi:predicted small lipoprotein YifL
MLPVSGIRGMLINSQKEAHMKKHGKSIVALLAMIVLIAGLSGCAKEGPMEKAGKKVDKAVEDIKK